MGETTLIHGLVKQTKAPDVKLGAYKVYDTMLFAFAYPVNDAEDSAFEFSLLYNWYGLENVNGFGT